MESRSGLPERIGPYQVVRELGRGGMGVVYVARHAQLEREVALKVLLERTDPTALERFRREAQVAAQIEHPNIVPIRDFGRHGELTYVVMDLIQGESLEARITRDGPLDEREAIRLTRTLADALDAVHARGVLHRDLKPHNVLLRSDDGQPLLTDFGLAKVQDERLTRTGQMLGTPAYMPPEQVDAAEVSAASDVYGLGATLFHMLTGRAPFDGTTSINIVTAVLGKPAPSPGRVRPGLDPRLVAVCLRCLEKDARLRYGSMAELDAALADCLTAPAPAGGAFLLPALLVGVGCLILGGGIVALARQRSGEVLLSAKTPTTPPPAVRVKSPSPSDDARPAPTPTPDTARVDAVEARAWRRSPVDRPSARQGHRLVWDPERREMLLFGGRGRRRRFKGFKRRRRGKWEDSPLLVPATPHKHAGFAMAYDGARARLVLFTSASPRVPESHTWTWDGRRWKLHDLPVDQRPPARSDAAVAYDAERQRVVLFGGFNRRRGTYHPHTWVWDGERWHKHADPGGPPMRRGHAMAYDPIRKEVVLFGGLSHRQEEALGDTWTWSGRAWTRRRSQRRPPSRTSPNQLAWDPGPRGVVLVGGKTGVHRLTRPRPPADEINAMRLDDTWLWDGREWRELTPTTRPPPTYRGSLVYDPTRKKLVLYGGEVWGRTRAVDELWEF